MNKTHYLKPEGKDPVGSEAGRALETNHPGVGWCLAWLGRNSRRYFGQVSFVLAAVLLESCFIGALPLSFQHLVDQSAAGNQSQALATLFCVLGIGVSVASIAGITRNRVYAKVVAGITGDLRDRMFCHLQKLTLRYFSQTRTGETVTRFSADIHAIETSLVSIMPLVVTPGIDLLVSAGLLFWVDWRLALVAMLIWPLALAGPRWVMPGALRATSQKLELESQTLQWVQENLAGQSVVKAFALESRMIGIFRDRNRALTAGASRLHQASGLVEKTSVIGIWTLQVLVLLVGAWMTHRGSLTVGALGAFQALFMTLANSFYYVSQYAPTLIQAGGAMRHIETLLQEAPEMMDRANAVDLTAFEHRLAFHEVSFSYAGERMNLDQVTFEIAQGTSVAFVGASGSGKSTLAHLILRLYDPTRGHITIDGHRLTDVSQRSWRRNVGLVSQDNFLFNASVRENIRHGKPSASDAEVVRAAKTAGVHQAILKLSHGYDHLVGEAGGNLSGGERQRVAIARALLANPAVLVLDEATSALDAATEALVNRSLADFGRDRTLISVTHRLASVVDFDRICVFDQGRLVEQGRHDELLARRGVYYRLWCEQQGEPTEPVRRKSPFALEAWAASARIELTPGPRHRAPRAPLGSSGKREPNRWGGGNGFLCDAAMPA